MAEGKQMPERALQVTSLVQFMARAIDFYTVKYLYHGYYNFF